MRARSPGRHDPEGAGPRRVRVGDLIAPVVVSSGETLEGAMLAQAEAAAHVAVVTEDGAPAGIATAQGILAAYRAAREAGGRSISVPSSP